MGRFRRRGALAMKSEVNMGWCVSVQGNQERAIPYQEDI